MVILVLAIATVHNNRKTARTASTEKVKKVKNQNSGCGHGSSGVARTWVMPGPSSGEARSGD